MELRCLMLVLILLALRFQHITAAKQISRPNNGQVVSFNEGLAMDTEVMDVKIQEEKKLDNLWLDSVTDSLGNDRISHFRLVNKKVLTSIELDYELVSSYTIVVKGLWNEGSTDTVTFTLNVNNLNDEIPVLPANPALYTTNFDEEQSAGTVVFPAFTVTDADSSAFTFSLSGGHSMYFNIHPTTGVITTKGQLDRDLVGVVTVFNNFQLNVEDESGNQATPKPLTVNLLDINDNTPICSPSYHEMTLTENPGTGASVALLTCTDADDAPNDIVTYQIQSGDDDAGSGGAKFTMSGSEVVTSAIAFDADTKNLYTLIVVIKDGGSTVKSTSATVSVTVLGVTPQWGTFSPAGPVYTVSEDVSSGYLVATLTATDIDPGEHGVVEYYIMSVTETSTGNDMSGAFHLQPTSGELRTVSQLDYDTVTSYTLQFKAQDRGTPAKFVTKTLTVTVQNINDNDPVFSSGSYTVTIPETVARAGTWTGLQLTATDADRPGVDLVYEITSGNTGNRFDFSSSTAGFLEQSSVIEVDHPTEDPYQYFLTVKALDEGNPSNPIRSGFATVIITITTESNDYDPVFGSPTLSSFPLTIDETAPIGTSVATLPVSDKDREKGVPQSITYAFTGGNTNGAFAIDPADGEIITVKDLDYETSTSYSLVIEASDSGVPSRTATYALNIAVNNVNEYRPVCQSYSLVVSVLEEAAPEEVISASCTDDDTDDPLTYSLAPPLPGFTINSISGMVSTLQALDYETATSYTFVFEVVDSIATVSTATVTVTVQVLPLNEYDPVFSPTSYSEAVPENSAAGTSVTTVTATDDDDGALDGTIRYSIVAGNDLSAFAIDPTSGEITATAAGLDRELGDGTHTLTVRASDDIPSSPSERTADVTVIIILNDVNDNTPLCNPVDYQARVTEPSSAGVTVLSLTVTDDDEAGTPNATPSLSITGGNTDDVFGTTGLNLVLLKEVDYETETFYSLTITVTDGGTAPLSSTCRVDVTILSAADYPPVLGSTDHSLSLSEDTPPGTTIFDAEANDLDVGEGAQVTFSIINGNDDGDFFCFPTTGQVMVWNPLDYDSPPQSYNLTIEARDDADLTDTMWLHVQLTDLNDETPVFRRNVYRVSVSENAANWTEIVTVIADDHDTGENGAVFYTAISGNGVDLFSVDPGSGVVTTNGTLDHETRGDYSLVVSAEDGGVPSLSSTVLVSITVTDYNDNRPVFTPGSFIVSVSEDAGVGTSVTSVSAMDGDATSPNNDVLYVFLHTHFELDAAGALSTIQTLDRETRDSFVLEVKAVDGGAPAKWGTATVTVVIDDVNDNDPVIAGTYQLDVAEDAAINTVATVISATDADAGDNARLNYVIVNGNTNDDFVISEESGVIQVRNQLDREGTVQYLLVVEVNDNGDTKLTATTTVTVTITGVNDIAPAWGSASYSFSVSEDAVLGTSVGKVTATDADIGPNADVTYSEVLFWAGNQAHITVDGVTGVISTAAMLDRELIQTYTALLRASDAGVPPLHTDVNVSIVVIDVNDNPPVFDQATYITSIPENQPVGTEVFAVTVTDDDIGVNGDVTLTIDTSTAEGARADIFFQISQATGLISVKSMIDRETDSSFVFTIVATDDGNPSLTSSASVIINITDLSDNAPVFTQTYYNTEISYVGHCSQSMVTLTATDADTGVSGEVSYYLLTSGVDSMFQVDTASGQFNNLLPNLNRNAMHFVEVSARDGGTPSLSADTPALVRVDGMVPEDVVIVFEMGISPEAFLTQQSVFMQQIQAVMRQTYPTALARLWCVGSDEDGQADVYVYFLKDNSTGYVANSRAAKYYVTQGDARSAFTSDITGTPGISLSGSELSPYYIQFVQPYAANVQDPWHTTVEGIAVIVFASLLGVVLMAVAGFLCFRYCRRLGFWKRLSYNRQFNYDGYSKREAARRPGRVSPEIRQRPKPVPHPNGPPPAFTQLTPVNSPRSYFWDNSTEF